ncbi:MAG: cyclopropane-fatty-acyl-phospholipid synthase [Candidatus Latescibacterota bacterium]|jgi:cyclopropane-fatty-acyl-phospholipid synthase
MSEAVMVASDRKIIPKKMGALDRLARKLVLNQLAQLQYGTVSLVDGGDTQTLGEGMGGLKATVYVDGAEFYRGLAFGGTVGAADAYIDGFWQCDDLVSLFRIVTLNQTVMRDLSKGWARLGAQVQKMVHALHRNTRSGSQKNIAAHYDLGNDFYRLWLDKTMMYSCAVYENEKSTLDEAAVNKLNRICKKLDLKPEDHVLEIGTGWGGFAVHMAVHYGCRVTTTTISKEQHALAVARVQDAGLEDRVSVLLEDYRDLAGQYDKLVSIEMIEAVGYQYYDTFFKKCSDLLKPDGLMVLQAITMSDWAYETAKDSIDFIKSHVFPGSCIPSVTAISNSLARVSDLKPVHLEDIGTHYVRTLHDWCARFWNQLDAVRAQGFDERFIRMWEYYLCYCEGGFAERYISDVQIVMAKPMNRRENLVPQLD